MLTVEQLERAVDVLEARLQSERVAGHGTTRTALRLALQDVDREVLSEAAPVRVRPVVTHGGVREAYIVEALLGRVAALEAQLPAVDGDAALVVADGYLPNAARLRLRAGGRVYSVRAEEQV